MQQSFVVTGGGREIGRAIAQRMAGDGHAVVVLELYDSGLDEAGDHALKYVIGNASHPTAAREAAEIASSLAPLKGWVNNAAQFKDAWLHNTDVAAVRSLIDDHLNPALVGSQVAIQHFLKNATGGSILNISSHQASRPVPGCLPYATAKAAIEGLTRSIAVDYGSRGIRANALSLGSIATERYQNLLTTLGPEKATALGAEMARLHPLGRVGSAQEIASIATFLLSDDASFITGAVIPVDGGRSTLGADPEAYSLPRSEWGLSRREGSSIL